MIILDTNVMSALMLQSPETRLLAWLDRQPRSSLWTTAITVMEVFYGLYVLPAGRRRESITRAFEITMESKIEGRIIAFDSAAARCAAEIMALRKAKGRLIDLKDTMIAGIVLANHALLATRNVAHFSDLGESVVNPWIV